MARHVVSLNEHRVLPLEQDPLDLLFAEFIFTMLISWAADIGDDARCYLGCYIVKLAVIAHYMLF